MKCKCRNNSLFPQLKVGEIYTFRFTDKHEIKVVVQIDGGENITMYKGSFMFTFNRIYERKGYGSRFAGFDENGDYKQLPRSSSMVDPTCPIF